MKVNFIILDGQQANVIMIDRRLHGENEGHYASMTVRQ